MLLDIVVIRWRRRGVGVACGRAQRSNERENQLFLLLRWPRLFLFVSVVIVYGVLC